MNWTCCASARWKHDAKRRGGASYWWQHRSVISVNDLDAAVAFYTKNLGFQVNQQAKANFAMLSRGNLEPVLSTPFGPIGAAKPMPDARRPEPPGWNRIIINVDDLEAEVARLRKAQLHFRNDIVEGPGGSEILLDDPLGNAGGPGVCKDLV